MNAKHDPTTNIQTLVEVNESNPTSEDELKKVNEQDKNSHKKWDKLSRLNSRASEFYPSVSINFVNYPIWQNDKPKVT